MDDAPRILPLAAADDLRLCGGKALQLARMLRAGLPVPAGFVVTTAALSAGQRSEDLPSRLGQPPAEEGTLAAVIVAAYRGLGSPIVAVRSSATAEDQPGISMAGQSETMLGVSGEEPLLEAVQRCWQSLHSERLRRYLAERQVDIGSVAMAVIVQRLIPAEVSGVLFTANPRSGARGEMLIEAAWGLGEAIVSGLVQPDTVLIDRATGQTIDYLVADKRQSIPAVSGQPQAVAEDRRRIRCLPEAKLRQLWELARRAVRLFGDEQDIEWALAGEQLYLLQSRPITTLEDTDAYRACLQAAREGLRAQLAQNRGPWVRHNLAETLPHPSPLTWSILGRFMSGAGGFGQLYRRAGFEPAPAVCRDGFLELVAGRVYADLSRAPEMYFSDFPYRYDPDLLRCRPAAAQQPPSVPARSWLRRVAISARLAAVQRNLDRLAADLDRRLVEQTLPELTAWVAQQKRRDLTALSADAWAAAWRECESRLLDGWAVDLLLPSMIAGMAVERLRAFLGTHCWEQDAEALLNELAVGREADQTIQMNGALRGVGTGAIALDNWLSAYGHRGSGEFDLAAMRWRERPAAVQDLARQLADAPSPLAVHQRCLAQSERRAEELARDLPRRARQEFAACLGLVRRYLPWREDGKAMLMLGYDLLRDLAWEAGRRLAIGERVFLLTCDELRTALAAGQAPVELLHQRAGQRAAERRIYLPGWIGADELETLGVPAPREAGGRLAATAVSSGVGSGPARIVHALPEALVPQPGAVLVCPSTDPGWTPLFVGAAALVLECGGTLSHGAVVAREMGIPAVILPDATRHLVEGETITIDGHTGAVIRALATAPQTEAPTGGSADVCIAHAQVPPPPGTSERRMAWVSLVSCMIWGLGLWAVFMLPRSWCYAPALELFDGILWPLVPAVGRVGTVAAVAVGLAAFSAWGQRLLTDHRRLVVAKRRASDLRRQAASLPAASPRRRALQRAASGVPLRLLAASLVPLAILLGPMVLALVWLAERIDPAAWNPPPGAVALITATLDGDHVRPVEVLLDPELRLDVATPARQVVPPVRAVLAGLLGDWREGAAAVPGGSSGPVPTDMILDLQQYLAGPLPERKLHWKILTPPAAGRFEVVLDTGRDWTVIPLVVGERDPPPIRLGRGQDGRPVQIATPPEPTSPLRQAELTYDYPRTQEDRRFFVPLSWLRGSGWVSSRWTAWDAGWLLTYIAAYLAALLPLRRLLRLP